MSDRRKRVFIGSSTEGLAVAEAIQLGLEHVADVTVWPQGFFDLTKGTLETLAEKCRQFDFAVLVLTPDDVLSRRGEPKAVARDNVLLELGLFVGALGRERVAIVHGRHEHIDLPSDLLGVTPAKYSRHSDGNLEAALGGVCTRLKKMMSSPTRQETEQAFISGAERMVGLVSALAEKSDVIAKAEEAEALNEQLEHLREFAADVLCPNCDARIVDRGSGSESVEYGGREMDIDHSWDEYECGHRIEDGKVVRECPSKGEAGAS